MLAVINHQFHICNNHANYIHTHTYTYTRQKIYFRSSLR
jgi:hypothetical protein